MARTWNVANGTTSEILRPLKIPKRVCDKFMGEVWVGQERGYNLVAYIAARRGALYRCLKL